MGLATGTLTITRTAAETAADFTALRLAVAARPDVTSVIEDNADTFRATVSSTVD